MDIRNNVVKAIDIAEEACRMIAEASVTEANDKLPADDKNLSKDQKAQLLAEILIISYSATLFALAHFKDRLTQIGISREDMKELEQVIDTITLAAPKSRNPLDKLS